MYKNEISALAVTGFVMAGAFVMMATPADAVRRKACMADHFHYGSSSGKRSKKIARQAAIQSWREFTAFEYGSAWASFRKARSTAIQCSEDASGWGCNVEGVPCR